MSVVALFGVRSNTEIMTGEDAVVALDKITGGDPEMAHSVADDVLLALAPAEVQDAYVRLVGRCRWWACA